MIVDPDFADHWKTRMLVGLLDGDEAAPVYVLRLWAHCQNRKKDTFEHLTQEALKSLCRFPGHSNKLESSLLTSGFIRRDGQVLVVCGWSEYNASLVAAWSNGKKGGRPKTGNPRVPKQKPTGSREDQRRPEPEKNNSLDQRDGRNSGRGSGSSGRRKDGGLDLALAVILDPLLFEQWCRDEMTRPKGFIKTESDREFAAAAREKAATDGTLRNPVGWLKDVLRHKRRERVPPTAVEAAQKPKGTVDADVAHLLRVVAEKRKAIGVV